MLRNNKVKTKKVVEEVRKQEVEKIAEFKYAYFENAQRVAIAHALSSHLVKVRQENSTFIVEIYH